MALAPSGLDGETHPGDQRFSLCPRSPSYRNRLTSLYFSHHHFAPLLPDKDPSGCHISYMVAPNFGTVPFTSTPASLSIEIAGVHIFVPSRIFARVRKPGLVTACAGGCPLISVPVVVLQYYPTWLFHESDTPPLLSISALPKKRNSISVIGAKTGVQPGKSGADNGTVGLKPSVGPFHCLTIAVQEIELPWRWFPPLILCFAILLQFSL